MTNICDHASCPFIRDHTLCTSQIGIFSNLPRQAQQKLIAHAVLSTHPKDQILIQEGQPVDSIVIIRKGRLKTRRIEASGNEHVLDILHDGQAIWHDMFLPNPVYHYSVVCLTDVEICEIRREEFLSLMKQQPETAMRLIQILSSELKKKRCYCPSATPRYVSPASCWTATPAASAPKSICGSMILRPPSACAPKRSHATCRNSKKKVPFIALARERFASSTAAPCKSFSTTKMNRKMCTI